MAPYQLSLLRAQMQLKGESISFDSWFQGFGYARRERQGVKALGQLASPTAPSRGVERRLLVLSWLSLSCTVRTPAHGMVPPIFVPISGCSHFRLI